MSNQTVWIVDDDNSIRWVLEKALSAEGIAWRSFAQATHAQVALKQAVPDLILSDVRMPGISGLDWLAQIKEQHPDVPVIVMTAFSDLDTAVTAFQKGAFEYLAKPFDIDQAVSLVKRALQLNQDKQAKPSENAATGSELLGQSLAMQSLFRSIGKLSQSSATVLVTGESGTGKELVAQALHRHSPRAQKPFIALNTAAIPKDLLESELFGHERGSFTGAAAARKGRFEQAQGGTLFLDEIGDMPAELQTRLLRVLAEGQFYRVGGTSPVSVDVRVIAATHQHLESRVKEGLFREDLFHRLNVIRLQIPALRERPEDVNTLSQHFLKRAAQSLNTEAKWLDPNALQAMQQFSWPGNVRQLENTCQWLTVMTAGQQIKFQDLPAEFAIASAASDASQAPSSIASSLPFSLPITQPQTAPSLTPNEVASKAIDVSGSTAVNSAADWQSLIYAETLQRLQAGEMNIIDTFYQQLETVCIQAALSHTGGHKSEAAQRLGLGRNTLTRKAKAL